jgi:hypothetical protein
VENRESGKWNPYGVRVYRAAPTRPSRARLRNHVSLNGSSRFLPLLFILLPQDIPSFTDVILISLYVIGCVLSGGITMRDFIGFFGPATFTSQGLAYMTAKRKPQDPSHKTQQRDRRANRKLLRQLIWCAAALPGISSSTQAFNTNVPCS